MGFGHHGLGGCGCCDDSVCPTLQTEFNDDCSGGVEFPWWRDFGDSGVIGFQLISGKLVGLSGVFAIQSLAARASNFPAPDVGSGMELKCKVFWGGDYGLAVPPNPSYLTSFYMTMFAQDKAPGQFPYLPYPQFPVSILAGGYSVTGDKPYLICATRNSSNASDETTAPYIFSTGDEFEIRLAYLEQVGGSYKFCANFFANGTLLVAKYHYQPISPEFPWCGLRFAGLGAATPTFGGDPQVQYAFDDIIGQMGGPVDCQEP